MTRFILFFFQFIAVHNIIIYDNYFHINVQSKMCNILFNYNEFIQ